MLRVLKGYRATAEYSRRYPRRTYFSPSCAFADSSVDAWASMRMSGGVPKMPVIAQKPWRSGGAPRNPRLRLGPPPFADSVLLIMKARLTCRCTRPFPPVGLAVWAEDWGDRSVFRLPSGYYVTCLASKNCSSVRLTTL